MGQARIERPEVKVHTLLRARSPTQTPPLKPELVGESRRPLPDAAGPVAAARGSFSQNQRATRGLYRLALSRQHAPYAAWRPDATTRGLGISDGYSESGGLGRACSAMARTERSVRTTAAARCADASINPGKRHDGVWRDIETLR
jgi:hypothetical protein